MSQSRDLAETIALQALAWLAGQEDLLRVFMGATGATPGDLRARAGDPAFHGAVLDFLLMDDDWIRAFAADHALAPESIAQARAALPGGEQVHWT